MKMRKIIIVVLILLGCSGALLISSVRGQARSQGASQSLALVGAKIYPSPTDKPIIAGIVLVRNGKIVAVGDQRKVKIPKNTRTLDSSGLILVAGFWNSHVHFTEPKWENANSLSALQLARQIKEMLTRYGFTAVLDTGSFLQNTLALRRRIASGEVPGITIRTTGSPFVPPDGTPFYVAPVKLPELTLPEEATKQVRERIALGVDAIKLFAASPVSLDRPPVAMPVPLAKAAVTAAHALGKPVVAHPTNSAGINVVLESGIDILAHTTPDGAEPWSDELVKKLRSAGVALAPTLKLWKWELERKGAPSAVSERFLNIAVEQLRAYSQAGGEILFGTDVGYMSDYDPTDEYLLMAKAGMDFRQILAALTTAPAKRFGVSERTGRIIRGMDADFVLLSDDPATDVKAFSKVRFTLRQGKVIYDSSDERQAD